MPLAEYVRPQKHNSWFNVIPERDFPKLQSPRVPFLDSFVTIQASPGEPRYVVLYEGERPLQVTLRFGFVCVWFGDDLDNPAWPFPALFQRSFGRDFVVSRPRIFKDTNLLDLIENNGDPTHFKTVHRWLSVRIWDHEYTDRVFRLRMNGTVQYGRAASSVLKRRIARFLPTSTYTQELAFHGPGFGAGQIETDEGLQANLVLAFTPIGEHDLKLHLAASVNDGALPAWLRGAFRLNPFLSLHDLLSWALGKTGIDDTDGDYRIWRYKRSLRDPKLLPNETDILRIRRWMSQFYLADFRQPPTPTGEPPDKRWVGLAPTTTISSGKVHPFTVAGEELIAYLTTSGDIRVFEAHCPHQGAHLGRGGRLKDDCVSCPFHHFCFNTEGEFVGTRPNGRPKALMNLAPVEHRVRDGHVEVLV